MGNDIKKTILLVEDEAVIAIAQKMSLEKYGYNVITAGSGLKALDVFRSNKNTDLILMDIDLGKGIDGPETASIILTESNIPIVFLSSHTEPDVVERTEKITSYGYVVKNSGITVLDASIKMAFRLFEADRKIVESEERFRRIFEEGQVGIVITNRDFIFEKFNRTFISFTGYSQEELVSMTFMDITHADYVKQDMERVRELVDGTSQFYRTEKKYIRKTGEAIWGDLSVSAVRDADNNFKYFLAIVVDITERKMMEDALRKSEYFFKESQRAGKIGSYYTDFTAGYWESSEVLDTIFGIDKDYNRSIQGWLDIIHPDDKDTIEQYLREEVIAGRKPFAREYRIVRKNDGETRWVYGLGDVKFGSDGGILSMIGTILDITERKKTELALAESEQRLNFALSGSNDGIWDVNMETGVVYLSPRGCEILGYKPDELQKIVNQWNELVHPDDLPETNAALNDYLEGRIPLFKIEQRLKTSTGGWKWILTRGKSVSHDQAGRVLRIVGTHSDISDRKLAEEASRKSKGQLYTLLQTLPDLVWLKDLDGVYLLCNSKFERFFGAREIDIVGKTDYDFMSTELAEFFRNHDRNAMAAGKPTSNEEWITYADDGHREMLETIKTPMYDDTGALVGVLGIGRDITARKKAEEEIKSKNGELEALNEELKAAMEEMEAANEELISISEELQAKERDLLSEKKFTEALLESIPGYLYVYDDKGTLIRWNKKHEEMTGYSAEELSHMTLDNWFDGDDAIKVKAAVKDVFKKGFGEVEANLNVKGGGKLLVHENGVRLVIDGKIYLTGVGVDISERKRVEAALRESEEKYRLLHENSGLAIVYYKPDGRVISFNRLAAENMNGHPEDFAGKSIFEIFPQAEAEFYFNRIKQAALSDDPEYYEDRLLLPSGEKYLLSTFTKIPGLNNTISGIQIISQDITERKKMEEALRQSEEQFKHLVRDMQVGVLLQGPGAEIILSNPKALELLGLSEEQLLGKTSFDPEWNVIHEDGSHFPGRTHPVPQSIATLQPVRGVIMGVYRPVSCDRVWLLVDAEPQFDPSGSVSKVVCTFIDITVRKRAEDKIRVLLVEKELILKEVHHRIKNNMNTIYSLLALQADSLKDTSAVMALEDAGSRVQSMMVLYDKLYQSEDFKEISVMSYFPALIDEIAANFPNSKSVKIEKKIDDFNLDTKRLQPLGIIVNELITNIMKYAFPGRGEGLITVSVSLKDGRVIMEVGDNGVGIPPSVDFENSSGFGMQLVGMLTEQLKGSIRLKREKGTSVILEFDV